MRDVLALIGFQGMVNEIILGILDPLHLDTTSKVETFHPLCSYAPSLRDAPGCHEEVCESLEVRSHSSSLHLGDKRVRHSTKHSS